MEMVTSLSSFNRFCKLLLHDAVGKMGVGQAIVFSRLELLESIQDIDCF
jgi:hypothetical protein